MKVEEATDLLIEKGLKVATPQTEMSNAEVGTVIKQDPAPETAMAKGDTVTLTISGGSTTIPNLAGKTLEEAEKALKDNNLILQLPLKPYIMNPEEPEEGGGHGRIRATSPEAGKAVAVNQYVELTVYQDPEQVIQIPVSCTIPDSDQTLRVRIVMRAEGSDTDIFQSRTYELTPDADNRVISEKINLPDDRPYYAYVYINDMSSDPTRMVQVDTGGELNLNTQRPVQPEEEAAEEILENTGEDSQNE